MLCYSRGVLPVATLLLPYVPGAVLGTGRAPEAASRRAFLGGRELALGAAQLWAELLRPLPMVLPQGRGLRRGVGRARTAVASCVPREPPERAALSFAAPQGAGFRDASNHVPFVGVLAGRQPSNPERSHSPGGLLKKVTLAPGTPAPRRPRKNAPEQLRARRRDTPRAP